MVEKGNSGMPWIGLDIGETVTKLVYFEPVEYTDSKNEMIQSYLSYGIQDDSLQLNNIYVDGSQGNAKFTRFPTNQVSKLLSMAQKNKDSYAICATGGALSNTDREFICHQSDELNALIKGVEFTIAANSDECYYYDNPLDDDQHRKVVWQWPRSGNGIQYPYILVNICSGVSVFAVDGQSSFERVCGSSIGGGFFQGLCCLLCNCATLEEAIELASEGDNRNVDKLVLDIYGEDYDAVGLSGDIVAASFGKICSMKERDSVRPEDLARSALVTITNNIGSIAMNAADQYRTDRIVFVGSFLRANSIVARLLSNAMDFWSGGTKRALFLEHEGYFGAVGCLFNVPGVRENSCQVFARRSSKQ
ncbi:hypothetical protein QR680_003715 [Steinernema hermaphroditum]|uniref:pantothenate kinase n=1 Tax=Steinernema hermaphroditum TaxID=289476 RepID=A0AA39HMB7_9BILA|nr:hypothetical protein QR680_003715 [Steinernema hermaphroditum]